MFPSSHGLWLLSCYLFLTYHLTCPTSREYSSQETIKSKRFDVSLIPSTPDWLVILSQKGLVPAPHRTRAPQESEGGFALQLYDPLTARESIIFMRRQLSYCKCQSQGERRHPSLRPIRKNSQCHAAIHMAENVETSGLFTLFTWHQRSN